MIKPMFQGYETPQDYINEGIIPIECMTAKEEGREHLLEEMFRSDRYIAEDKLDGVRATLHIFKDHIRVFSRRISKKTGWYAENTDLVPHIRDIAIPELAGTILDAELIIQGGVFKDIASTMNCNWEKAIERQIKLGKVTANVFDCIYYTGDSIEHLELVERKIILKEVIDTLNSEYINEVRWFDNTRKVVITDNQRKEILDNKTKYPTVFSEILGHENMLINIPLGGSMYDLSKKAYYEYYVMIGGEGIILKDKKGLYHQKRGREYTKVKKFTTRDVVITGYTEPTRDYEGKYRDTWRYWEDPITKEKYDAEVDFPLSSDMSGLEPITKYYFEDWIGTINYSVVVTEEDLETWKKINPKETPIITKIDGDMYLEIGETSGLTEEERINFSENQEEYIGLVIEVKAHEVIKKTGRLRHPRYMRNRLDKEGNTCTMLDHLGE